MGFENHIYGGRKIPSASTKLRDMLQIQVFGQKIIKFPISCVRRICRVRERFLIKTFIN